MNAETLINLGLDPSQRDALADLVHRNLVLVAGLILAYWKWKEILRGVRAICRVLRGMGVWAWLHPTHFTLLMLGFAAMVCVLALTAGPELVRLALLKTPVGSSPVNGAPVVAQPEMIQPIENKNEGSLEVTSYSVSEIPLPIRKPKMPRVLTLRPATYKVDPSQMIKEGKLAVTVAYVRKELGPFSKVVCKLASGTRGIRFLGVERKFVKPDGSWRRRWLVVIGTCRGWINARVLVLD